MSLPIWCQPRYNGLTRSDLGWPTLASFAAGGRHVCQATFIIEGVGTIASPLPCSVIRYSGDAAASSATEVGSTNTMQSSVSAGQWQLNSYYGYLSEELLISSGSGMPEADRYSPDVAANWHRDEYLVVWHNDRPSAPKDVYARRVSSNGELLSWFAVASGPTDRVQPAVAYNSVEGEYLVVYMRDYFGDGTMYEILGRIISADGSSMGPEFMVITYPQRSFWTPRVACNPHQNQYLVVWNAIGTVSGLPVDVSSMLLRADGVPLQGRILTASTYPQQADVAYNMVTNEYFLVFVRAYLPYSLGGTGNSIYGLRISAGNSVVPSSLVEIRAGGGDQDAPRIAVDGRGDMMAVYEEDYGYGSVLTGSMLDRFGSVIDVTEVSVYGECRRPAMTAAFGGSHYMIVLPKSMAAIWASHEGDWDCGDHVFSYSKFWEYAAPAIAANPPQALIVYERDSIGDPTIKRQIYVSCG